MYPQENRRAHVQAILEWLLFLYPVSLAVNKSANNIVCILLFLTSVFCLCMPRALAKSWSYKRWIWIITLCVPLIIALLQNRFLSPPLAMRDIDDLSRYFLCIPIYFSLLILVPRIRPFLWGCVFYVAYTIPLMFWHMHIQGLERGISPNGFLGIIPHTSLAIILAILALYLAATPGPVSDEKRPRFSGWPFSQHLLPAFLLMAIIAVPMLTQTRSGLLLALLMALLVWYLLPGRHLKALACGGGTVALVVLLIFGNNHLWTRGDNTLTEIVEYSEKDRPALTSATTRVELWRTASKIFLDHPLLGVGNHRFRNALEDYKRDGKVVAQLEPFSHPHNEILKFSAESGLLGLLSLALLYFVPLSIGWRAYRRAPTVRNPALLLVVFSFGFLIAGLVDVILAWHSVIMFYGVVTSVLIAHVDIAEHRAALPLIGKEP